MLTGICAAVVAIWFVCSCLNQFSWRVNKIINRYDTFHLNPRWTFFAPNPGSSDYHLVYRDADGAGQMGPWQELVVGNPRTLVASLWHPGKRAKKVVTDYSQALLAWDRESAEAEKRSILLTLPYLSLLNLAVSQPRSGSAKVRQFALVESYGFYRNEEPQMLMHSEVHSL